MFGQIGHQLFHHQGSNLANNWTRPLDNKLEYGTNHKTCLQKNEKHRPTKVCGCYCSSLASRLLNLDHHNKKQETVKRNVALHINKIQNTCLAPCNYDFKNVLNSEFIRPLPANMFSY